MKLRHTIAATVAALVLAPTSAHAARAWTQAEALTTASSGSSDLAVAGNGDVIAAWTESPQSLEYRVLAAVKPAGAPAQIQTLGNGWTSAATAAGRNGSALVAWDTPDGDLFVARRAPGQPFGPAEQLPFRGHLLDVATNASGALALAFVPAPISPGDGVTVSFGSLTGPFSAPVPLIPQATPARDATSLRLTARGEAIAAVGMPSAEGNIVEIRVGSRSPADATPSVQTLATATPTGRMTSLPGPSLPMVGADAAGNAVVGWLGDEVEFLERPAGTTMWAARQGGDPVIPERKDLALAMTDDGTITLAGLGRAWTLRTGGTPKEIFRTPYAVGVDAVSNGQHAAIAVRVNEESEIIHRRTGAGRFGPAEDLRPDCGPVGSTQLALGTEGHAAALFTNGTTLALTTDRQATATDNGCIYKPPPGAKPQPFPLIRTRVGRTSKRRTVAFDFDCGDVQCDAFAAGRLQLGGAGVLARDSQSLERAQGQDTLRLRFDLSKADQRKIARARGRKLEVVVKLSARDDIGRRWESTVRRTIR